MIIFNYEQGSTEWKNVRLGCITASMFRVARERLKTGDRKGQLTAAAKAYSLRLAIESISGEQLEEEYVSWQMLKGKDLEPMARIEYEILNKVSVDQVGFISTDDYTFGVSPDGLIGKDGGLEIKCLFSPDVIREVMIDGNISRYMDQIQGAMWLTGRKWWDLCVYIQALESTGRCVFVQRIERDDNYIELLERDLIEFSNQVREDCKALSNPHLYH